MRSSKLVLLMTAGLLLAACGQKGVENAMERQIEKETAGDADVDVKADGSMEIKTDDGTATIDGGAMPSDWPEDVKTYAGATVTYSASVNEQTGEPGMAVVLMSTDDVATVAAFYKKELAAAGWTMGESMEASGTSILSGTKDDRVVSLMITGAEGQSASTIAIGKEQ